VAVADLDQAGARKVAAELGAARTIALEGAVGVERDANALVDSTLAEFGGLDVLVATDERPLQQHAGRGLLMNRGFQLINGLGSSLPYRMDHMYKRHRFWTKTRELKQLPSEYFRENIYLTFQDDWTVFRMIDMVNPRRLLWANDFPHSNATWPRSRDLLLAQTSHLTDQEKN
jgi:hypothetical protein